MLNASSVLDKSDLTVCYGGGSKVPTKMAAMSIYCKSKNERKDQDSIQSSTTPDQGYQWERDNFTIRHHKREPRGQPFPSR